MSEIARRRACTTVKWSSEIVRAKTCQISQVRLPGLARYLGRVQQGLALLVPQAATVARMLRNSHGYWPYATPSLATDRLRQHQGALEIYKIYKDCFGDWFSSHRRIAPCPKSKPSSRLIRPRAAVVCRKLLWHDLRSIARTGP